MKFYEAQDYQDKVNEIFKSLEIELSKYLNCARIIHIGASSLQGAVSKGDLDVFVGVSKDDFESSLIAIKNLGYIEKEGTLRTSQLCMLVTDKYDHDVAIQLVENGSEFEDFLKFKNILSKRPYLVEEYNELKRSSSHLDEDRYRSKKSKWVESLLENFKLLNKTIKLFEKNGLGLLRDNKVRLVEHNKNWGKVFDFESKRIIDALNIESLKLHHCGSTGIPNIVAKPILDIVGEVLSLEELDEKKAVFFALGYEYKGEYGISGRRYSVLYNEDKSIGYCHLHIFKSNSEELLNHVIFKNYLINNPEAARRYESVKKSLDVPKSEYSSAKTQVILELVEEAKKKA